MAIYEEIIAAANNQRRREEEAYANRHTLGDRIEAIKAKHPFIAAAKEEQPVKLARARAAEIMAFNLP